MHLQGCEGPAWCRKGALPEDIYPECRNQCHTINKAQQDECVGCIGKREGERERERERNCHVRKQSCTLSGSVKYFIYALLLYPMHKTHLHIELYTYLPFL